MTPLQVVEEFVDSLPQTIRELYYTQIVLGFEDVDLGGIQSNQFEEVGRSILAGQCVKMDAPRIAMLCGLIAYIQERWLLGMSGKGNVIKEIAEQTSDAQMMTLALAEPLKFKHIEQAQATWTALRTKELSHHALMQFELSEAAAMFERFRGS